MSKKKPNVFYTIKGPEGQMWLPNYMFKTRREACCSLSWGFKDAGYKVQKIEVREISK